MLLLSCLHLVRAEGAQRGAYTVQPLSRDFLSFTLSGKVENTKPHHHRPNLLLVPIKWVRFDGENVKQGDPIIEFDTTLLHKWHADRDATRSIAVADLQKQRRKNAEMLSDLVLKRRLLEAEQKSLLKQIAATRVKDETERKVLALQVEQAQFEVEAARKQLERLRALAAEGALGKHTVQEAEERYELAVQALRVPKVILDVFDTVTGSTRREILELDLAALELELGNDLNDSGVFGEIESLKKLDELHGSSKNAAVRLEERLLNLVDANKENNVMVAETSGTFIHNPDIPNRLEPGVRNHICTLAFVLQSENSAVDAFVSESVRHLLNRGGEDAESKLEAVLHIPAIPGSAFPAHVAAVGSVPEMSRTHGDKGFSCRVEIDAEIEGIRPGMTVEVHVHVPVPPTTVTIPVWLIEDPLRPEVVQADGARRPIGGFVLGNRFVVARGLDAGESLLLPWDAPPASTIRLSGAIRPADYTPISWDLPVHFGSWRNPFKYRDVVPDGSVVRKGDVLAVAVDDGSQFENLKCELDYQVTEADAMLGVARLNARNKLVKEFVAWRRSELLARKARINYLLERYLSYEIEETQADVAQQSAVLDLRDTERVATRAAADTTGFLSRHQKDKYALEHALGRIAWRQATLNSVAALRIRDWLNVREEEDAMLASRLEAYAGRLSYSAARAAYQVDMMRAMEVYRNAMRKHEEDSKVVTRNKLYAPRDGRVFYCSWDEHNRIAPGRRIDSPDPLLMVDGNEWLFNVEVPARFYDRMHEGDTVTFTAPALDDRPRQGTIRWIAPYFQPREAAEGEREMRGSAGIPETVFEMRIAFAATGRDAGLTTPGLTAYLDVPREWEETP